MSDSCQPTTLRVRGLDPELNEELKNLSQRIGITKRQLLRRCIYQIVDVSPDSLKKKKKIKRNSRLKGDTEITNIRPEAVAAVENIAHNMHIEPSALIKANVISFLNSYPEHMRKPLPKT